MTIISPPTTVVGLSSSEAANRLLNEGRNELPSARAPAWWQMVVHVLCEPMFLLLLSCCIIYLLLGDWRDSLVLSVAIAVVIGITFYQRFKTEHALAMLRELASPRALTIRDGIRQRIPAAELVRGDYIVISEGDRVPADAVLRDARHLQVDESLLTGEAVPVSKCSDTLLLQMRRPGNQSESLLFSGTLITQGHGVAEVLATGERSELGRIGRALQTITSKPSLLQIETDRLVKRMAIAAIFFSIFIAWLYGYTHQQWVTALLVGLSTAMSLLPEEIPVVLTVFLALSAWRLSHVHVLTRELTAIEALGTITVLCVDKTGTLTENRMRVAAVQNSAGECCLNTDSVWPETQHELIEYALLATRQDPFDPMEQAIQRLGLEHRIDAAHFHQDWRMLREYPLSRELLAMSQAWQSPQGQIIIAAKGAPEAIADLCHCTASQRKQLSQNVAKWSRQGLRVLAVARANLTHQKKSIAPLSLPTAQHEFSFEILGLLALSDPLRANVPEAMQVCRQAGVRVLMITGDHIETATSIAQQAGFTPPLNFLSGSEIDTLDNAQLARRLRAVQGVARAIPEHKLRIVQALQCSGEIVAMTGDGVNDAPALRAADIGIAMGERGSDVAREAAALVLTDDNFQSIVDSIAAGRRVFRNLQQAMLYIVAVHVPIAGIYLLPLLLGWPILLLPTHIAFLELIVDPACSIAFESEPADAKNMQDPPRPKSTPMLDQNSVLSAVIRGALLLASVMLLLVFTRVAEFDESQTRTLGFSLLTLGIIWLATQSTQGKNSGWRAMNQARRLIFLGGLSALLLVIALPLARSAFHFASVPWLGWLALFAIAAVTFWLQQKTPISLLRDNDNRPQS